MIHIYMQDKTNRITPFLGKWKGRSVTKRSGVYGSTIAEANTVSLLEIDDNDQLVQVCNTPLIKAPEVEK